MFTEEWLAMFNREIVARRGSLTVVFAIVALAVLVAGLFYKPKFESSVTIFADNQSVITPLLEGAAAQTRVEDSATIAREILFSRDIVDDVIYRDKLAASESRLREFRTRYGEGVAASAVDIDEELIELRRNIDLTQLELSEAEARKASLARQINSEGVTAINNVSRTTNSRNSLPSIRCTSSCAPNCPLPTRWCHLCALD